MWELDLRLSNSDNTYKIRSIEHLVSAIFDTWNHEDDLFDIDLGKYVFSSKEYDGWNNEQLEEFGLKIIHLDEVDHACLEEIESGLIHKPYWI